MKTNAQNANLRDSSNNKKKVRNSNIELLRIVSMTFVVLHHFSLYSGFNNIKELTLSSYLGIIMYSIGKLGVNIFVLISGYFLINAKFSFKKILKFWLQVFFYSIIIMFIMNINNFKNMNPSEILKYFLPISYKKYWFASTYLYMYILFPFINRLVHCIKKDTYKLLVVILTIMFSGIYSVFYKSNSYQTGVGTFETLSWFIYLYLLAGYIRLYGIKFFENKKRTNIITIILLIAFIACLLFLNTIHIKYNRFGNVIPYYTSMNSAFILILSVSIIYCFINMKPKYSKIINFLGSVSFAVYLIHEHSYIRMKFWSFFKNIMLMYNINMAIMAIICLVLIYSLASVIESIRVKIFDNKIFKVKKINDICSKIDEKFIIE